MLLVPLIKLTPNEIYWMMQAVQGDPNCKSEALIILRRLESDAKNPVAWAAQ